MHSHRKPIFLPFAFLKSSLVKVPALAAEENLYFSVINLIIWKCNESYYGTVSLFVLEETK